MGVKYKLTIDAKTDDANAANLQANLDVGRIKHPHTPYGLNTPLKLETEWKTFEFEFTSDEVDKDNPAVIRISFGVYGDAVYFRNPSLKNIK